MHIKEFIKSPTFKGAIIGFIVAIIGLVVFQAGIAVGEKRSRFVHGFGDSFEKNFREPGNKVLFRGVPGQAILPGGYGAVGEIINLSLPHIIVAGPDTLEKTIIIGTSTIIREFQNELAADKLQLGQHIITLGEPNGEGQIQAKLIRLIPPPEEMPFMRNK